MKTDEAPLVSAVIPTRDRGTTVVRAAESVLSSDYPSLEVIVVDQSLTTETGEALRRFSGDLRLTYLKSGTRGISRARNIGVSRAKGTILAFTDDDCEVSQGWLRALVDGFSVENRIGVVFGNVLAGDHDRHLGLIPTYRTGSAVLARTLRDKRKTEGIGASMAMSRTAWEALGGFDEALGVGGEFRSAEDFDVSVRALVAGYAVYETPAAWVTHNGFRRWDEVPALLNDSLVGLGACIAKQLKSGDWRISEYLVWLAWRWLFRSPTYRAYAAKRKLASGQRPPRAFRLRAFAQGFSTGLRRPVNDQGCFIHR